MMIHDRKHYSPGPAELTFSGKSTGVKNMIVVFDSGSSYSYLNSQPYEAFLYSVSCHFHSSSRAAQIL